MSDLRRHASELEHSSPTRSDSGTPGKRSLTASLAGRPQVVFRVESAEAAAVFADAFGPRDRGDVHERAGGLEDAVGCDASDYDAHSAFGVHLIAREHAPAISSRTSSVMRKAVEGGPDAPSATLQDGQDGASPAGDPQPAGDSQPEADVRKAEREEREARKRRRAEREVTATQPAAQVRREAVPGAEAGALGATTNELLDRAASSASSTLPVDLREKFEESTGKDLSGVRVHTGAESQEAARAVGARAFAVGQDIHFGANEFAPGSPDGDRLIAHETFHTLQAPEPVTGSGVSSPGDRAEIEADAGADAMVAGGAAPGAAATASVVHRAPKDNSYNGGTLKKWEGGKELTEADYTAFAVEKVGVISKANEFSGKAIGFKASTKADELLEKLVQDAETDYEKKMNDLKLDLKQYDDVIDGLEDQDTGWFASTSTLTPAQKGKIAEYKLRIEAAEKQLKAMKNERSSKAAQWSQSAQKVIGEINSYAGAGVGHASTVNSLSYNFEPDMFKSAVDASGKLKTILSFINTGTKLFDRTTINDFEKNPNFDTASAWATHVGSIFESASFLADGLPMGWDTVIKGVMTMPKIVIGNFISLVKTRYEKIDRETREPGYGKGQILPEGTSGP